MTIQDGSDEEEEDDGRDFAPGGDADYFAEEDEDGRFLYVDCSAQRGVTD